MKGGGEYLAKRNSTSQDTEENGIRKRTHTMSTSLTKCDGSLAETRYLFCPCLQDHYFSQGRVQCVRTHQFCSNFYPSPHPLKKPVSLSVAWRSSSPEMASLSIFLREPLSREEYYMDPRDSSRAFPLAYMHHHFSM